MPLTVALVALPLFATGVGPRPAGALWDTFYDLVLYNVINLASGLVCWQAARRTPREALAWRAMALAQGLNIVGNLWWTLVVARQPVEPPASLADVFYLAYYPVVYVGVIALIRGRVTRFHRSMWLDGLIGALGATAVAVAVLLRPALHYAHVDGLAGAVAFAYPVADVLQLALLFGVGGVVGVRRDRSLWLLAGGLIATFAGDVVLLDLQATGTYVEGGPLDLTWLTGMVLVALAAAASRPSAPDAADAAPAGWSVLAVPAACIAASLAVLIACWDPTEPRLAEWSAVGCIVVGLVRTGCTLREVRLLHEVRQQARTDDLTGLPNRRALLARAEEVLAAATPDSPAALLLLDLDGFKDVNDSLGHSAGDELLRRLSPRLTGLLPPGALAARLGGDEFALLLAGTSLDGAVAYAHRVREAICQPVALADITVHVGVSIGTATAPVPAGDVTELLRCADVAMYAAKSAGSGRSRIGEGVSAYLAEPDGGTGERLRAMAELRAALETPPEDEDAAAGRLLVHLQPQVRLADGEVVGAEALVRWRHPARGLLMPSAVLPPAEQAGLLGPLTERVLDLALSAAASWWGERPVPVSVNLATANLADLELPRKVAAALAARGLPPTALTLEVVEDTLMTDPERARDVLGRLRALGVRIAIDDYGTGYSSLAHLTRLPADELKLDQTLLADLTTNPACVAVVRHTVALAHDLGLRVVGEGVEDSATLAGLRDLSCDVAQGYALARPMPVADFVAWLEERLGDGLGNRLGNRPPVAVPAGA